MRKGREGFAVMLAFSGIASFVFVSILSLVAIAPDIPRMTGTPMQEIRPDEIVKAKKSKQPLFRVVYSECGLSTCKRVLEHVETGCRLLALEESSLWGCGSSSMVQIPGTCRDTGGAGQ